MAICSKCGEFANATEGQAPLCTACLADDSTQKHAPCGSSLPAEFDHRGIRLPARTRVGGIIIPQ